MPRPYKVSLYASDKSAVPRLVVKFRADHEAAAAARGAEIAKDRDYPVWVVKPVSELPGAVLSGLGVVGVLLVMAYLMSPSPQQRLDNINRLSGSPVVR